MTPDRLKQLRALCEKATKGRWIATLGVAQFHGVTALGVGTETIRTHVATDAWEQDAAFIAESRSAIPELLHEVERLSFYETTSAADAIHMLNEARAEIGALRAALTEACDLAVAMASDNWRESDIAMAHIAELRKAGGK